MNQRTDSRISRGTNLVVTSNNFHFEDIKRARNPDFEPIGSEDLDLMLIDIDQREDQDRSRSRDCRAIIKLFALDNQENSYRIDVFGFRPQCYFDYFNVEKSALKDRLNQILHERDNRSDYNITMIEEVERENVYFYKGANSKRKFFKVYVDQPKVIPAIRDLYKRGIIIDNIGMVSGETQESNLPQVLRFMIDKGVVGMGWFRIKNFNLNTDFNSYETYCNYELEVHDTEIKALDVNVFSKIVPLRILSFDIECLNPLSGKFPSPEEDPVITIGICCTNHLELEKTVFKQVLQLNSCMRIQDAEVVVCDNEKVLFDTFKEIVVAFDPDIFTGYNIEGFDFDQMIKRNDHAIKSWDFPKFSRYKNEKVVSRTITTQNQQMGNHEHNEITCKGRVLVDLFQSVRRDVKLASYSLNNVATYFLGLQKDDVKQNQIRELFETDAKTRSILAKYCFKDCFLVVQLMKKLMTIQNTVEMARVTGVPMQFLLSRGQSIKVLCQIMRFTIKEDLIIPLMEKTKSDVKFEGATVLEPKVAFYRDPIATLDFASLQPSIMMAHNLCYSTLVDKANLETIKGMVGESNITRTPVGEQFVNKNVREGLLPRILQNLISARKKAKKDMKAAKDAIEYAILDGRQLALKISANSVYGFTGALVGQMPCLEVSTSVTGFGRTMIEKTKELVEQNFKYPNQDCQANVIQGDTDSVMIKFKTYPPDMDRVEMRRHTMDLAIKAAELVNKGVFKDPIKIEFEKVYHPQLLISKKRQAGLQFTKPEEQDKIDTKGLELVRRDNCELVRNCIEQCLNMILVEANPEKAFEQVKKLVGDMQRNKTDISLLIISKTLNKKEEQKNKQPHTELADKMFARDPGNAPKTGDRVPFVLVQTNKGDRMQEKAEDPIQVLENNLQIDQNYQVDHQFREPIGRLFEPVTNNEKGILNSLFSGDHTMVRNNFKVQSEQPVKQGLKAMMKEVQKCRYCKSKVNSRGEICQECQAQMPGIQSEMEWNRYSAEKEQAYLWSHCMSCQNSMQRAVYCNNKDCPILQRRLKALKDLENQNQQLSNIHNQFQDALDW